MEPTQSAPPAAPGQADPYRAPGPVAPPPPVPHAPGRALAWIYAAALAIELAIHVATRGGGLQRAAWNVLRYGLFACDCVTVVTVLAWLYAAWKSIPEAHRGSVSPRRAAFSLLVPFYNAYWGIAVNMALCETLDGILERAGSPRRAARSLGIVANAVWLGSYVVLLAMGARHLDRVIYDDYIDVAVRAVTGSLWFAYMIRCDRAREAVARLGSRAGVGAPRLSELQRTKWPGPVAVIRFVLGVLVLAFLGLACWQVLDPSPRAKDAPGIQR